MSKWYKPYLVAFDKMWTEIPMNIKEEIREKVHSSFSEEPIVSVVLIAHNEEKRIGACLWSLCNNLLHFPTEIIVVDNMSTDGTVKVLEELGVTWFREEKKGPGFARACGLQHARGKYHLCIDSDTLYPPQYIDAHVRQLERPGVVCTYSLWSFLPDSKHSCWGLWGYEFLRDIYLNIQNINRPEKNVRGMVLAFHTELARKVGFNTNIIRGEDGMMALGLKKYGKLVFIKSRKARAITCSSTLDGKGSLWQNLIFRFKKGVQEFAGLFHVKEYYEDRQSNMIDKSKKKLKIVYLYSALDTVGGADRVITEKVNYFAEEFGYDLYVVTAHQNNAPLFFPLSPKVKHIDLGVNFPKQYGLPILKRACVYFILLRQYKRKLKKLLFSIRPDFTVTTISRDIDFLYSINDGSFKVAEAHVAKPFLRNLHRMAESGFVYKIVGKIWTYKLERAIKRFDALVVLTNHDAKSWEKIKRATVIPNSMPFYPETASLCTSKKVISIGRYDEQKGYDLLIDAWEIVHRTYPDWNIYIYGDGALRKKMEDTIRQKHLEQSLFLCDPVRNIEEKYLESSIYVMSSRFEGFGMVLIEAMACGVPCISFDCPYGPSDVIMDEVDGLLVSNGNIQQLSEKICHLIQDNTLRLEMGNKARINVLRYSKENIMQQWKLLFEQLMSSVS